MAIDPATFLVTGSGPGDDLAPAHDAAAQPVGCDVPAGADQLGPPAAGAAQIAAGECLVRLNHLPGRPPFAEFDPLG